jgi:2-polyprenyl-3-methyl-5-hydroxy-6-metoxy-1,4-benzoquinol methylase
MTVALKASDAAIDYPCDLCGSDDAAEIIVARHYMGEGRLHICRNCGFVYVRRRRSAQVIADEWSNALYQTKYTGRIPAIVARQTYVAEFINSTVRLRSKRVCDIGAGEGLFLNMIRGERFGAEVFGIEPSAANGRLMAGMDIEHFVGTIEDYAAQRGGRVFDIATVMWTLENCQSCLTMLKAARELLTTDGVVVVSTGSRILVPVKKPLHYYLGRNEADTHAFRFSAKALARALVLSGFTLIETNRYIDTDYLVMVGRRSDAPPQDLLSDDWREVQAFFERWHDDTQRFYANT